MPNNKGTGLHYLIVFKVSEESPEEGPAVLLAAPRQGVDVAQQAEGVGGTLTAASSDALKESTQAVSLDTYDMSIEWTTDDMWVERQLYSVLITLDLTPEIKS